MLALCRGHGCRAPLVNHFVPGMEVDFVFPGTRVLVEADSWRYHHSRAQFARDRERDGILARAGYRVLRFADEQIVEQPSLVAATIATAHDARGAGVMRVTPDSWAQAASRSVERWSSPVPQRYRAPRPSAVRLLHTVDAAAPRSASAVTSTRVTHFTHWKPRCPGQRVGAARRGRA